MKKLVYKVFAGILVLGAVSCTGNFEKINSNPYQPGDLNPDDYALGAAMNALAGCVVSSDVNTTQFTDCLLGGPMGGYFADSKDAWMNTISNFNPTDDWSRVFLKSDKIIPILYSNLEEIRIVSVQTENPVPYAIATIIKVATMHRVADTFGPIPYTQIGMDGNIATPYDPLDKVYDEFFKELNSAINVLTENQNAALVPSADYIYGGNVTKWLKFANSLKLRLAVRIAYADPVKAKSMAEEAIANPVGVITSNEDNAAWNYFNSSSVNPIYTSTRYNSYKHPDGIPCLTGGDTHAAADIICYMNGYKDPRREKYFVKSEWAGREYVGLRRSITIPSLSIGHKYSGVNITTTDPLWWMNAAEVAFLRAEGVAVFGFDMGGSAEDFYNEGIRLSFEQWGVEGVDEYLGNNSNVPELYDDPAVTNTYNTVLSSITVKWDNASSVEEKQERIIVQKWIANWQLGNEAWADHRRTGYPKFFPATASGNKSGGIVDSEKGARRMPYPLDEYVSNTANIKEAVTKYLNGEDNMATRLWWDCKQSI